MRIQGIIVSDLQGRIHWPAVATAGIRYAVTHATEGVDRVADTFSLNWVAIPQVGLTRGAYHQFRPQSDPRQQADRFLSVVRLEAADFPPVLEVSSTDGVSVDRLTSALSAWLGRVEAATQRLPILRVSGNLWRSLGNPRAFSRYPVWIVHHSSALEPAVPAPWDTWTLWEYSDRANVAGIVGWTKASWFNCTQKGTSNPDILELQKRLQATGFYIGKMDGVFGDRTEEAVIEFQTAAGERVDGIVGPKTWSKLAGGAASFFKTVTQESTTSPEIAPGTRLSELFTNYQSSPQREQLLEELQQKIPQPTLKEFARQWREQVKATNVPIYLVDVAKYYRGLPHHVRALDWLQKQLPAADIEAFAAGWHEAATLPETPLLIVDAVESYRALPYQNQALEWLHEQMSPEMLREFASRWRR